MRGGGIYENQVFIRTAFVVLGIGMIIGAVWGLWIEWKLR
jgi:hypothetical protein